MHRYQEYLSICICLMTEDRTHSCKGQHDNLPLLLQVQQRSRILNLALHSWVGANDHCMDRQVLAALDARCRQSQCAHYDKVAWD